MKWIFLSPHLDDAVLSCGGMIHWLVAQRQSTEIWTICAGDPPPGPLSPLAGVLHERWQTGENAPEIRRREDIAACAVIRATPIHFDIPECIYRLRSGTNQPLIGTNDELFQPLPESEKPLAYQISRILAERYEDESRLVSPLAVGGHIDHHLVRAAAEGLNRPLYYYPDYPYTALESQSITDHIHPDWESVQFTIRNNDLSAWQSAAAAYQTQVSTFWPSLEEMKTALRYYHANGGGGLLWFNQYMPR